MYRTRQENVPFCRKVLFVLGTLLAMTAVCSSCRPEEEGMRDAEDNLPAIIRLEVQGEEQADIATRAVSESAVGNLHVLVYNSTGELIGQKYQTGSSTVTVNTRNAAGCTIYAIANTGKADLFKGYAIHKESYLKSLVYNLTSWDELGKGTNLLMTGSMKSVNIKAGTQTLSTKLVLTRMVARVTLNIKAETSSGITITNYSVKNIPSRSYYIPRTSEDAVQTTAAAHWKESGVITTSGATSASKTFYMFENRRGTKSTISAQKDKTATNAPDKATYVVIHGLIGAVTVTWTVYLGENNTSDFNIKRNGNYKYDITLKATFDGYGMASDSRVIIGVDLSEDGYANCYLAATDNAWYNFNATVRGNGETEDYAAQQYGSGISLMPGKVIGSANAVTIPQNQIKDAIVVWETNSKIITSLKWDSSSGYVKFKTGTAKGNALIAVRNSSDQILWSWHIWRTDGVNLTELNKSHVLKIKTNTMREWYANAFPDEAVKKIAMRERELVLMECKLGALLDKANSSLTFEGNTGAFNLSYQFGRKDPFPLNDVNTSKTDIFYLNAVEVTTTGSTIQNNLDYSIRYPGVFIKGDNWINNATLNSNQWKVSNCLWGDNNTAKGNSNSTNPPPCTILDPAPWGTENESGKKTIYDPCPAGWRVAPADTWTGIGYGSISSWYNLLSLVWKTASGGNYFLYFGGMTGASTFLPVSGFRNATDALIKGIGTSAYSWMSSPCGPEYTMACVMYAGTDQIHIAHAGKRSLGFAVRCVKETSL
jgi:hypothetical protein